MSETKTDQRPYRATFILDTQNFQGELEELFARYRENIEGLGCAITHFEDLGTKEFQRVTDRRHPSDVYLQIHVQGEPSTPADIHKRFRLDKTVKRIIVESR